MPRRPDPTWQLARSHRLAPIAAATDEERRAIATSSDGWLFDLAWDGHRVLAAKAGREVRILGAERRDLAHAFPRIASALGALPAPPIVVEGFVCMLDASGRPSFDLLVRDAASAPSRVVLAVTDLLHEGDVDLTDRPAH